MLEIDYSNVLESTSMSLSDISKSFVDVEKQLKEVNGSIKMLQDCVLNIAAAIDEKEKGE